MADCMRAEFVRAVDSDGHGLAGALRAARQGSDIGVCKELQDGAYIGEA
jgi:hypothetical protein